MMRRSCGYVLLLSVIIIGSIVTTIAVSLLLMGIGSSRTSYARVRSDQTKALAQACVGEALQRINDSTPFTGTDTLTFGAGSCSYTVTNLGAQNREITASGTVDTTVRRIKVTIDKINPVINVVSWQEVADF